MDRKGGPQNRWNQGCAQKDRQGGQPVARSQSTDPVVTDPSSAGQVWDLLRSAAEGRRPKGQGMCLSWESCKRESQKQG